MAAHAAVQKTEPTALGALPAMPGPAIGRDKDIQRVVSLFGDERVRLVTIVGAGGVGKTTLALAVAASLSGSYQVHFADLSQSPPDQLVGLDRLILEPRTLIVLDSVESLGAPAAVYLARLLEHGARAQVLVTSRAPLQLRWEQVVRLRPLDVPDANHQATFEQLQALSSIQLFVERATACNADFQLTPSNASVVAELCAHLDGLPLAIEHAAAQCDVLHPRQILQSIQEHGIAALHGTRRDAPARHQSLRASMEWSYGLLEPEEQSLFTRLATFTGDFTPEAGFAVLDVSDQQRQATTSRNVLVTLVRSSMIERHSEAPESTEPRFRMLNVVRDFALHKLHMNREEDRARQRHAEHFMELAERMAPRLRDSSHETYQALEAEHINFRTALNWSLEHDRPELALRMAAALWRFWYRRGHLVEGSQLLERVLEESRRDSPTPTRAGALAGAGLLAADRGEHRLARNMLEAELEEWQLLSDARGIAEAMNHLGLAALLRGDHDAALAHLQNSIRRLRAQGDDSLLAYTLSNRCLALMHRGDFGAAQSQLDEANALFRLRGDARGIAFSLNHAGTLAYHRGALPEADALVRGTIDCYLQLGDRRNLLECLEKLAIIATAGGQASRASHLLGAAAGMRSAIGAPVLPPDRPAYDGAMRVVRQASPEASFFRAAFALGQSGPMEILVAGLDDVSFDDESGMVSTCAQPVLTRREREVASLVARGLTNRQIADKLVISEKTAETHVHHVLAKLSLRSRLELIDREKIHDFSG